MSVREQDGEAGGLDLVATLLGDGQGLVEDGDRRLELVHHRVGAAERVGCGRLVGETVARRRPRFLDAPDRGPGVAAAERDLSEACQGAGPLLGSVGLLERGLVQLRGGVDLVEPERELGLDERRRLAAAFGAGRQEILADSEPPPISRSSCSDGIRSPASILEMYAGEQPGNDNCRWLRPARSRASLRRRPTSRGSSTCVDFRRGKVLATYTTPTSGPGPVPAALRTREAP